ncbi:hypothetical protein ACH5RR_013536 [Cinchona calisaya]|uniref:Uncharacterized protein n=1 Tax=Cinchona calisaya TaxID=153742 RepID=A0ABD3A097_9GENT
MIVLETQCIHYRLFFTAQIEEADRSAPVVIIVSRHILDIAFKAFAVKHTTLHNCGGQTFEGTCYKVVESLSVKPGTVIVSEMGYGIGFNIGGGGATGAECCRISHLWCRVVLA